MSAATAEVIDFPEPEYGDGDDGFPPGGGDWLLCLFARLMVRMEKHGKVFGVIFQRELWELMAVYCEEHDLPEKAEQWRAMAANVEWPA